MSNNNNNNNWKRIGGFSRTGTQNYVRTNDAAMGGTTFGSTDVSNNIGNTTLRIGNNAGVIYINGDIDMSGGVNVGAPINRIRNVRDPIADQDVATKFYVDERVDAIVMGDMVTGPTGPEGPPGIGIGGQNGSDGPTGNTGCTGPVGATGSSFGVKGPTGERGGTGTTGANGAPGATGPIGPVGEKGDIGTPGTQGIQGSNGTILWLNPDGDSPTNQLITDSYLLSTVPINTGIRTVGPVSASATYGNTNKVIPVSRFFNTSEQVSTLAVIPSGVWVLNLYANVPSNSDANQISLYAAVFMISGTTNQPSPDSLIIETKDGGDAGYYPPRAAYLPDHVKYVGKSWDSTNNVLNVPSTDTTTNKGVIIDSTTRKLYKLEMPVEFTTLKDASGNQENVYIQLQIYIRNTIAANQTANVSLYFQTDPNTNETTYSYLQTTFGAVGIRGIPGSTGSTGAKGDNGLIGPAGPAGATGSAGPTGIAGPIGPRGSQGPTGVTGPEGSSNSYGVQYAVQYRGNVSTGNTDNSGNFRGDTNFRYIPTGYINRLTDASAGSVVLNDLACNSIHSPVYVQDTSIPIDTVNTRPRTYIRGGELVNSGGSAEQSNYVVLASGTDTTNGSNSKIAVSVNDITNGIKMIHNYGTKKVTFQVHDENKGTGKVGLQFDLSGSALGNISAAQDKFCIVNSSGAVGVGGITASQLSASPHTALNRMLHVRGNVMVGSDPGGVNDASNAMVLLNKSTTTPSAPISGYPGVYHRQIASGEVTALGGATNSIVQDASGLGFISPNFITFQTGSSLQNNSIVINQAGVVSVTGRTNLNGAVTVNKNFGTVETHDTLAPVMDISGTLSVSTGAPDFSDVPRIKLISRGVASDSSIPSATTASSNEIRGVSSNTNTSGFLRLSAQTPAHSCIDLIGLNTSASSSVYNNAVRISTGGTERMIVNGSGNVGIGTTTPIEALDVNGNIQCNLLRTNSLNSSGAQGSIQLATKNSVRLHVDQSGNVGIGTTSPNALLHVVNNSEARARFTCGTNNLTFGIHATESFFWNESATRMSFGTNNNGRMYILADGAVGIGTSAPTALLHVTGSALVGALTATSGFTLTTGQMALPIDTWHISGDGRQRLYYQNGQGTIFKSNIYYWRNSSDVPIMSLTEQSYNAPSQLKAILDIQGRLVVKERLIVNSSDTGNNRVGIGTDNPEAPLHIATASSGTTPNGYFFLINANFTWTSGGSGGGGTTYSLITDGNVLFKGPYIWWSSDKRIKKNVRVINGNTALSQVRKLRPTIYNNIDSTKGINNVYGFVAQEVKDVILDSTTSNSKDYVPNFYCKGDIYTIDASNHIYEITSENEFRFEKVLDASGNEITNYKIKLYDETNKPYICELLHRIDAKTIRVKCDKEYIFSRVEEYKNKVFIYGQEIHDFHNLDKNVIFTVATAALQEVDREQQADKVRIAELESTVASLESTVATQQSLINDILERLKTLEA